MNMWKYIRRRISEIGKPRDRYGVVIEPTPMMELEDRLGYKEEKPEHVKIESRRTFLGEMGALGGFTVFLAGSCGVGLQFCRHPPEPALNRELPQEFDYHRHYQTMQELSDAVQQASTAEGVPEYILEGMILACSDSNPYSPQQGLGGVILLDPIQVGATQDMLDRDPSLSIRRAAQKYRRIRAGTADDEEALAIFFSSEQEAQAARERAVICTDEERLYQDYISPPHSKMVKQRREMVNTHIEFLRRQGRQAEIAEYTAAQEDVLNYPNSDIDFVRNHDENLRCTYFVNNLNEWASEAVKLALYVHPEYSRRYWREQE